MSLALAEAKKAGAMGEVPVGAVIVSNSMILGKGYNQVESLSDPTAHAEIIAITAATQTIGKKYLTGSTMYVTLEPCAMCSGALINSKIDTLVFGAMDERSGGCGSVFNIVQNKHLNHRIEVIQGIMEDECSVLLTDFFKELRRH